MKRVEIIGGNVTRTYTLTDEQYQLLNNAQSTQEAAFPLEFKDKDGNLTKRVVLNTRRIFSIESTDISDPEPEPEASTEVAQAASKHSK